MTESGRVRRYAVNRRGRDIAVGDVHGHFSRLEQALAHVDFDPLHDRLFCVGDLVDRGPESAQAEAWLARPWMHAVRGNHEDMALRYARDNTMDLHTYRANGGGWFIDATPALRAGMAACLARLPWAIEVATEFGLVGLIHADCPVEDWARLEAGLARRDVRSRAIWDRRRVTSSDARPVAGVRAVVVGHTPLARPLMLGNVYHIDTAGWMPGGYFTLLDLQTLEVLGGTLAPYRPDAGPG